MRLLAAAIAIALTASACCFDAMLYGDEACVVTRVLARPYCFPFDDAACVDDAGVSPPPPPWYDGRSACEDQGGDRYGDDCEDHGFTKLCQGGYFVRPLDPC